MLSIKDMVKDKQVAFVRFKGDELPANGVLIYRTECGFEFPVPIKDLGTASLAATDKAIYLMRWIRQERKRLDEEAAMVEKARADELQGSLA